MKKIVVNLSVEDFSELTQSYTQGRATIRETMNVHQEEVKNETTTGVSDAERMTLIERATRFFKRSIKFRDEQSSGSKAPANSFAVPRMTTIVDHSE